MKKALLSFSFLLVSVVTFSQCDPNSFDWGANAFGVSPDPSVGENFDAGQVGVPYNDIVFVKAPALISDIPGAPDLPLAIDSLSLDSITFTVGAMEFNIYNLGLAVTCNNNGDSPIPCNFMAGGAYCGDISGTPNMAGSFPVKIYATGYFTFGPAQSAGYTFEGYVLEIGVASVKEEVAVFDFSLGQSSPNPANNQAIIPFELPQNDAVQFSVYNLMGQQVLSRTISGKQGKNSYALETSDLKNGVYLYTIQSGEKRLTKKLIVQH